MDFIAQIEGSDLTQLWKISSGDDFPRTLWVEFESAEVKQEFEALAADLGWVDRELGLALIRDFMDKHKD